MAVRYISLRRQLRSVMKKASLEVLRLRREGMYIEEKGVLDIVTQADKAAEAILTDWLVSNYPDDGIFAEEGTTRLSRSGCFWYFDPVDGTKNFAMGPNNPFFGISAGLAKSGVSRAGAICFPFTSEYFFAAKGLGAFHGSLITGEIEPLIKQPFTRGLKESVISLGLTRGYEDLFRVFKENCWNPLAFGSFVYEATLVINGSISAYVHTGATQFDVAAATLIAEEAGCSVSRFDGKPVDLQEKVIPVVIASNAKVLAEVLTIING
jgi:myo-inositol-1(or 4)-monophosphatase